MVGVLGACSTRSVVGVQALNPPVYMPELRAWSGEKALTMGADTGTMMPAVLFPYPAILLGAPVKWGKKVQESGKAVSLQKDGAPLLQNCLIIHSFFATVDGVVGWPELRRHVWHLDYAGEMHEFVDHLPEEVKAWPSVALHGGKRAEISLPKWGRCLLDSGAPHAVYLPEARWRKFRRKHPGLVVRRYAGESPAAGGAFVREYVMVPELKLGRLVLKNVPVCESFMPGHQVVLGTEILRHIEVWVDGPARRLYFRAYE